MRYQLNVLVLLLPSIASATHCPSLEKNSCVEAPHGAYMSSNGILTAAECCAQCVADGTLCSGYQWTAGGTADKGECLQFDVPFHRSAITKGNCTIGVIPGCKAKPPPKPPSNPPKGAKNVVFLVADGNPVSTLWSLLVAEQICGHPSTLTLLKALQRFIRLPLSMSWQLLGLVSRVLMCRSATALQAGILS